ncbi:UNVERIFIED_CONTAM: hypothetical protein K2H54_070450 [Gekko kuhli]
MTPKTPMKNEPIDLSKQKTYTPERNPITPVKLSDRPLTDPWTPTANLKMLISAASPDMRDREKKKELFRPIENSEFGGAFPDSLQCDAVDDGTADDYEKQRPSRKQKSLGLLCQKFLARYPSYPLSAEKTTISLDEVASSLGVERRRIYDIVNVLESLHLVSRVAKNQYCWHGRHSLSQTLKNLQEIGELQKYEELMAYFQHKEVDLECRFGEHKRETFIDFQDRQLLDFSETDCPSASANSRKDKSLRIMSQKFVMLFLVSKTKIVTLDIAAKILIEESQDTADHSKFKTKVRRLYDIANVLTSLGLIKKVHVTEERGRKPAFKWIGPVEFSADCEDYCSKMINLASVCCQKMEDNKSSVVHTLAYCHKLSQRTLYESASAEEEPTAKRQSMEQNDRPISLVLAKKTTKPMDPEASPDHNSNSIDQLRTFQIESGTPLFVEASIKEISKPLETQEQEKPYGSKVLKKNMNENEQASQENSKQSFLSQYFYVQPTSAVTSQLSSAPAGSFPNVTCMNFSMPGLASTAPVFIGTPAVITPNASQLSTLDPHQQIHSSVRLSPMLGSACSSMKADPPACMGHHLTLLKLQQPSSAPVTPKNIRPIHQETFFKTPGSLEDPVAWRKNEGNQSRTASSVQRRLEISSSSSD